MGERLNIVHGVMSLGVGGLERLVVGLIEEATGAGHRVSVLCVETPGSLAAEAERAGARLISLGKPPGRRREYILRAVKGLTELRPDVIHTHQIGAAWYLGLATRQLPRRARVVHTEHGNPFARQSRFAAVIKARLLYRAAARSIGRFCCVSAEIATAVTRWGTVPSAKVEVMPVGIRPELPSGLPSLAEVKVALGIPLTAPVVGTVGRLAEVKRQDVLIRAVARLTTAFPTVQLLLVGDGPERSRLTELARQFGLSDRVHFTGYQPQPDVFLGAMDVFTLTSRSEGFPLSLLEAWRAGKPVACSAVGGIPMVVSHGANGLLFPSGDDRAAATVLAELLANPKLAKRLGAAGRDTLHERYSLARIAAEYERRYRITPAHV